MRATEPKLHKYDGQVRALSMALRRLTEAQEANIVHTLYDDSIAQLRSERGALIHVIDALRGVLAAIEARELLVAALCRRADVEATPVLEAPQ